MNATPRRPSANPVGTSFTFERWNECDPAGLPKVHDTTRVHDTTKVHDATKVHDGAKVHDVTKVHDAAKVHDRTKLQGSAAPRPLIATTVPAPLPRIVPASTRSIWAEPTRNQRRVPDKRLAAAVSLLVLAVGVAAGALMSDRSATKFESAQGVVRTPAATSPNTASAKANESEVTSGETTTTHDSASAASDAVPTEEPADEPQAEAVVSVAPETSNTDPGPSPDTNLDPAAQQIAAAQQNVASTQLPAAVAASHAAAAAAIEQAIAAHAAGTSRAGLTPGNPSGQTPGAALESPTVATPTAEAPPAVAPTVTPAPGSPDAVPIAPAPAPQDPTAALLAAVFSTAGQVTAPLLNSVCLSLLGCPTN